MKRIPAMHDRPFPFRFGILVVALLALMATGAQAQGQSLQMSSTAQPDNAAPWARGVSPEARKKAVALRNQGKALAYEFQLTSAVRKYLEALEHWNHPAFHYDLCRMLKALDRPVEAYESVKQALRHGPGPLANDEATRQKRYEEMLALRVELERRLVILEIKSHASDTDVSVDNHIVTPGADGAKVLVPGVHRMAAQGPGHRPLIASLDLAPGTNATIHLVGKQPVATWKPWVTVWVGAGVTMAGASLYWHARNSHDALERIASARCAQGCGRGKPEAAELEDDWRRVRWHNRIGLGGLIVGGTVLLTGSGLVLWNLQRDFEVIAVEDKPLSITPVVSPALTGVTATLEF
jgi:tetratricopeptide (TPR) repeat protein